MHNGHHYYPDMNQPPPEYQGGNNYMHYPGGAPEYQGGGNNYMNYPGGATEYQGGGNNYMPSFGADGSKSMKQFRGIEFQPSEVCPRNFIIFDQTDHRSQVMYHPAIAHRFNGPGLNMGSAYDTGNLIGGYRNNSVSSSPLKENSEDIDALLSMEGEDEEHEYDEDEVSTARTCGNYGGSSPESCSNYAVKPRKNGSSSSSNQRSSASASAGGNNETKRRKMKKMMRALRGMVPGGNDMNSATVLDEAVQYLKSLKVEVQKLGAVDLDD